MAKLHTGAKSIIIIMNISFHIPFYHSCFNKRVWSEPQSLRFWKWWSVRLYLSTTMRTLINRTRLGSTKHTLYTLQHLPQLPYPITSVAAAQDHTLTSTSRGEVWSWGLNRFSQLGYAIDSSGLGHASGKTSDEPIQAIPRRVIGPLKKEIVIGVAASKIASACWTANEGDVYTWGTNTGQLG